jgi:hypothetical protein
LPTILIRTWRRGALTNFWRYFHFRVEGYSEFCIEFWVTVFFFRFWINSVAFERSASTLLRKKLRSSRLLTWRIGVSVASTRIKMLDRQNVILIAFNQHSVCHLFLVFIWSGDEDVLEDVDVENIIYEPTIDSFVRLGAFVAQKEYAKSFLGEEFV